MLTMCKYFKQNILNKIYLNVKFIDIIKKLVIYDNTNICLCYFFTCDRV